MRNSGKLPSKQNGEEIRQKGLDPTIILSLLKRNWYYFLLVLFMAFVFARIYIVHTLPIYRTTASILINETEDRPRVDNEALLEGLGLPGGMRNIDNQIMILKSRSLTAKALEDLNFNVEYYYKTIRHSMPVYPNNPIEIISEREIPLPRDVEFSVTYLDNNKYHLQSESDDYHLAREASFGEKIQVPGGTFTIILLNENWFELHKNRDIFFTIPSWRKLVNNYNKRLQVELLSRSGSILEVSITGTNRAKDVRFLNKLTEEFEGMSLEKKNDEALRRIEFIDGQLVGISDSLLTTENKLQQFRSANRVMDVSAQGEAIIDQLTTLETEKARLNLEANYYNYLSEYLEKDSTGEAPIFPITMGITDPTLTRLVTELGNIQAQLSTRGAGEMNPLQNRLEQRFHNTKLALLETLNGLRRANSLAMEENASQIRKINAQAAALPVTQRRLLGIERKFQLNNELYTFLLQTRAEQEMQKASNTADSEVIDAADKQFSVIVAPDPGKVYFLSLTGSAAITFLIIFFNFLFNKKLKEEDIRMITNLPIVGNIPRSREKTNTVVLEYPFSSIAESYRLMRSRIQFFGTSGNPVILVTSAMPQDGKTFTSINLASVYSLLGMNTVLVGFDLRKPRLYQEFNLHNEKGVSTWLIGIDTIDDIIQKTAYKNLSIISSGPVPLNPSELTATKKSDELISLLKKRFDYIIIDTAPMGLISDTFHLTSLADICLLIVRSGKTLRNMFESTLRELNDKTLKETGIIINDIPSEVKQYKYGDRYGYTHDKRMTLNGLEKKQSVK